MSYILLMYVCRCLHACMHKYVQPCIHGIVASTHPMHVEYIYIYIHTHTDMSGSLSFILPCSFVAAEQRLFKRCLQEILNCADLHVQPLMSPVPSKLFGVTV